jgi:hypothetical protein
MWYIDMLYSYKWYGDKRYIDKERYNDIAICIIAQYNIVISVIAISNVAIGDITISDIGMTDIAIKKLNR